MQLPLLNPKQPTLNDAQSYGLGLAEIGVRKAVINGLVAFSKQANTKIHDASKSPYTIQPGATPDASNFVSQLGTTVYSNIIFNQAFGPNGKLWDDFRIDDCLISVTQAKKIVTTEIQGKDGTVKEYIGLDDYQVSVVGRLSGAYNVNPKELTKKLKTILSAGQPLAITNWWLQNLDITDVVITDFNFAQTEGQYSTQYFSFNSISDKPVEVRITGQ